MGKTKKGKSKPHKSNPTGLISMKDTEMDDSEMSGGPINSILEQLQSVSADEKMCGLQALSTLCQKEHNIQAIVDSEIVRIASPLLVDQDANIRHAAAGALRNLSAVSVEICENLVDKDVFTPLLILLNQYVNNDWIPTTEKRANQLDQKSDTFLQAVNIVWNLCESTTVALESFNQSQLLQSFVRCLNYEVFGMDIGKSANPPSDLEINLKIFFLAISVGQCLLVISEDNATAWRILADTDLTTLLSIEGDFQAVMLRTVVAGIMSNVPVLLMQNLTKIIEALGKTIEINHRSVLNEITSKLPLGETRSADIEVIDEEMNVESEADASLRRLREEAPTSLEKEVKFVGYLLSAQRTAAEVLGNICTPDDEDMNDDDDAESVQDYDEVSQQNGIVVSGDKIPVEVAEAIKANQIVEKVSLEEVPGSNPNKFPHGVSNQILSNGTDTRYTCGRSNDLLRLSSYRFRSNCSSSGW